MVFLETPRELFEITIVAEPKGDAELSKTLAKLIPSVLNAADSNALGVALPSELKYFCKESLYESSLSVSAPPDKIAVSKS